MLKQDAENSKQKILRFALVISSFVSGFIVWNITGTSHFAYYGVRLTERQIIVGWLFLPVYLVSAVCCNLLIGKFLKRRTVVNQIFAAMFGFNISYYSFQMIKDVLIDSGAISFAEMSLSVFASVFLIVNVFAFCLLTLFITAFYLIGKLFVRKNLP